MTGLLLFGDRAGAAFLALAVAGALAVGVIVGRWSTSRWPW